MVVSVMVPWRRTGSWRCVRCGNCCRGVKVPLERDVCEIILDRFGEDFIEVDDSGNPFVGSVGGVDSSCVFLSVGDLCGLQLVDGFKPLACKLYPFAVSTQPSSDKAEESLVKLEGRRYYVQVDTRCSGIGKGVSQELSYIAKEAVRIHLNPKRKQHYTTVREIPAGLLKNVLK